MSNFNELKEQLLTIAREHDACEEQYDRAQSAENEKELLQVIYDNLQWCIDHEAISNEYLSKFDPKTLLESGIANTGKDNTGLANSGYRNSGDRNSGDMNSGYRNSGDRNSGDMNSGDMNSGDRNSGNWNSGDRNSGDMNSGYRNSGAFCTDPNPKMILFDSPCNMTVREWEQTRACRLMENLHFTFWIDESEMSAAEKEKYPSHKTTGGYLKNIPIKEGWANFWGNLQDSDKKEFTSLPNFDSKKFESLTGIKI
jgi:hypothetical protein